MARRTSEYTVETEGRDKGKVFVLTEMPANQAEKWAIRALKAAATAGVDIGNTAGMGMQGVAILGISALANMSWDEAEPLLDEMMTCVKIKETSGARELFSDDIDEVSTLFQLRRAVLELHVGFSLAGEGSKSTSDTSASNSSNAKTSRG